MADGGDSGSSDGSDERLVRFAGRRVRVLEDAIWGGGFGDGTGWRVWNSTELILRYLKSAAGGGGAAKLRPLLQRLHGSGNREEVDFERDGGSARCSGASSCDRHGGSPLVVLDMSAGTGAMGLALAAHGARVVATDTAAQVGNLQDNGDLNAALLAGVADEALPLCECGKSRETRGPHWSALAHSWGADVESVCAAGAALAPDRAACSCPCSCPTGRYPFDVVLAADVLFCAVRAKLTEPLAKTLTDLLDSAAPLVLFGWQDRAVELETEFVEDMAGKHGVRVHTVDLTGVEVSDLIAQGKTGVLMEDSDDEPADECSGKAKAAAASGAQVDQFHLIALTKLP